MSKQPFSLAQPTASELVDQIILDLANLHYAWDNFLFLFASEEKHIHIVNAVGGTFFGRMQKLMFMDVLLRISRITDPASVGGKATASLAQILSLIAVNKLRMSVDNRVVRSRTVRTLPEHLPAEAAHQPSTPRIRRHRS